MADEPMENDERYQQHVLQRLLERVYQLPSPPVVRTEPEDYQPHPTLQKVAKWLRVSRTPRRDASADASPNRGPEVPKVESPASEQEPGPRMKGWHHRPGDGDDLS